jgi:HEAT repeats
MNPYKITGEGQLTEAQRERLFQEALAGKTDASRFRRIRVLHTDGAQSTFERAAQACGSTDARHRMVGADVLGQLGYPSGKLFWRESVPILMPLLTDHDDAVVRSTVVALGMLGSDHGADMGDEGRAMCQLVAHSDLDVRESLAMELQWFRDSTPDVIDTLILLSRDRASGVRNWACFSLRAGEFDTPDVREALFARIDDRHADTRWEALAGLAVWADLRVRDRVLTAVRSGMDGVILSASGDVLIGAARFGDAEICRELRKAAESGLYDEAELREPLEICEANSAVKSE